MYPILCSPKPCSSAETLENENTAYGLWHLLSCRFSHQSRVLQGLLADEASGETGEHRLPSLRNPCGHKELSIVSASEHAVVVLWVINMFYRKVNTETIRGNLELFRSEPKGLFAAWCESVSLQTCCKHSPRSPEQKRSEPGYQRRACSSPRYPWPNEAFSILWVSAFGSHTPESSPATNCPGEWP